MIFHILCKGVASNVLGTLTRVYRDSVTAQGTARTESAGYTPNIVKALLVADELAKLLVQYGL